MEPITGKSQEVFSRNKRNAKIMRVGVIILDDSAEAGIGENW